MDSKIEHFSLNYGKIELSFFGINLEHGISDNLPILHRHNYYEIHFSGGERYEYNFDDKTVLLPPDHIIIIPPNVLHYSVSNSRGPMPIVVSFSMSPSCKDKKLYADICAALSSISLKATAISGISTEEIALLRDPSYYSSFLGVCRLKAIASDFIFRLFSIALKEKDFTVSDDKDIMVLIDNLINLPNISIKDIALATNYSERQVSRLIKAHYGLTLSQIKKQSKG